MTAANLNKKNVTVDNGYTLALDKDYAAKQTRAEGFDGSAYKTATFSEGYTASGGTITYAEPSGGQTLFTLSNATITDAITVDTTKQTVTLTEANLNKKNVTVDNGYTLALDKDYSSTQTKAAGFDGSAYKTATFSESYTASGGTINYTEPSGGATLFTLTNATITDAITVDTTKQTVTLTAANLNKKNVTVDNGYSLVLDKDYSAKETKGAGFDGSAYKTATFSEGYTASGGTITYTEQSGGQTLFTLTNATITDAITVDTAKKTVTLTEANLNKKNVTVDNGYTLALDKDYAAKQTRAEGFDGSAYKTATFSEGYTASGGTITYSEPSGGQTLFTLSNATITDAITVDTTKQTVTLTAANLNQKNVTVDNGYSLVLDKDYSATQTKAAGFDGSAYKTATFSEGYTASGGTITYSEPSGGQTLFTLSNATITDDIKVENNTITLTAANLNKKNVTVDNGYTLALDKDYSATQTKAAGFDGSAYKTATFSEGYTASGGTITYSEPSGGQTLFTLSNATITDAITVDTSKKTVTLTADNLNKKNVTVDNGYTLVLDKDYSATQTKAAGFDGSAYKTATFSESYTASGGTITYTEQSGGQTLFTLTNATITDAITVDTAKKTVTLTADNLNKKNVTVDGGYTLAISNTLKPATVADWKVSGTNASLIADTSAGYSIVNNEIVYSTQKTGTALMILNGLTKNASLSAPTNKVLTISADALGKNASLKSNAGNYSVKLTGNMNGKTFTGFELADTIYGSSGNDSILGDKGNDKLAGKEGNDSLYGGKGNDKIWGGVGNDYLNGYAGKDKLYGGSDNDTIYGGSGKDKLYGQEGDDYLSGDDGNDKLYGGDGKDTLVGGLGDDYLNGGADNDKLAGKEGNDSIYGSKGNDKLYGGSDNDTIYGGSDKDKLYGQEGDDYLSGDDGNDKLYGGDGKDTLVGGLGDDYLNGGDGNDKLAGKEGNDSLYGSKGNDKIWGGKGNDYLNGDAGNDKLYGGSDNDSIYGGSGKDKLYGQEGDDYLSGDDGNDKLYGGAGNDTLWGNAGNDKLYGGEGSDVFVYDSGDGNDVISGFTNDDMLKITGTFSASYNKSKKEIAFNIDSTASAITLKDFTATSFNVNGKNYKISGSKLIKK